ncbi:MAG: hypothetical protein AAGI45_12505 [Cyanobacteria bacterium P01_H01_bin.26]
MSSDESGEVVIIQRWESEVETMRSILRQELDDQEFQKVAQCLAKGLEVVQAKAKAEDITAIAEIV